MVQVTVIPAIGLPNVVTRATRGEGKGLPIVPTWLLPEKMEMTGNDWADTLAGAPAMVRPIARTRQASPTTGHPNTALPPKPTAFIRSPALKESQQTLRFTSRSEERR